MLSITDFRSSAEVRMSSPQSFSSLQIVDEFVVKRIARDVLIPAIGGKIEPGLSFLSADVVGVNYINISAQTCFIDLPAKRNGAVMPRSLCPSLIWSDDRTTVSVRYGWDANRVATSNPINPPPREDATDPVGTLLPDAELLGVCSAFLRMTTPLHRRSIALMAQKLIFRFGWGEAMERLANAITWYLEAIFDAPLSNLSVRQAVTAMYTIAESNFDIPVKDLALYALNNDCQQYVRDFAINGENSYFYDNESSLGALDLKSSLEVFESCAFYQASQDGTVISRHSLPLTGQLPICEPVPSFVIADRHQLRVDSTYIPPPIDVSPGTVDSVSKMISEFLPTRYSSESTTLKKQHMRIAVLQHTHGAHHAWAFVNILRCYTVPALYFENLHVDIPAKSVTLGTVFAELIRKAIIQIRSLVRLKWKSCSPAPFVDFLPFSPFNLATMIPNSTNVDTVRCQLFVYFYLRALTASVLPLDYVRFEESFRSSYLDDAQRFSYIWHNLDRWYDPRIICNASYGSTMYVCESVGKFFLGARMCGTGSIYVIRAPRRRDVRYNPAIRPGPVTLGNFLPPLAARPALPPLPPVSSVPQENAEPHVAQLRKPTPPVSPPSSSMPSGAGGSISALKLTHPVTRDHPGFGKAQPDLVPEIDHANPFDNLDVGVDDGISIPLATLSTGSCQQISSSRWADIMDEVDGRVEPITRRATQEPRRPRVRRGGAKSVSASGGRVYKVREKPI